jgi:transposase InsO family protein
LCAIAEVSRKGYYAYLVRLKKIDGKQQRMLEFIRRVQSETGYAVGYRHMAARIRKELLIDANPKRVLSLMGRNGLLSVVRRKRLTPEQYRRRREMKGDVPPNLLKRNFFSLRPRRIFVCDITYLYCLEQVLYLNSIVDLFNRELVAWLISEHCDETLCRETVIQLSKLCVLKGSIIHNDQGSSYLGYEYRDLLAHLEVTQSCSDVGK